MRFRAFLSYSHADAAWARWLLRRLETYRVPSRLVGTQGAHGPIERRLGSFFLDRDELPTAGDLGVTIRDALVDSAALIVLCSPAAAGSRWVNEEIASFRAVAHGRPLLCFVVGGEPGAADPARQSFPPALLQPDAQGVVQEPLAADARREGDGRERAFLKLVAGLLGVGYDALAQREAQRRTRRMAFVAAASLAGMAVALGLAATAYVARDDAQRRQAQAEDILGFMLGDLRKNLTTVGRLDLMRSVDDKATGYFATLDPRDMSDRALEEQARSLTGIGEVRLAEGNHEAAMAAFREAHARTAALYQRAPDKGQRLFDLAQAEYWIGFVQWQQGKLDGAETWLRKYRDSAIGLAAMDRDNFAWQQEVLYGHHNLAVLDESRGRYAQAEAGMMKVLEMHRSWSAARPADAAMRAEGAETMSWLGLVAAKQGKLEAAEGYFTEEVESFRKNAADEPMSSEWKQQLNEALLILAKSQWQRGRIEEATARVEEAVPLVEALARSDTENNGWQVAKGVVRWWQARVAQHAGNANAQDLVADSIGILQRARVNEPKSERLLSWLVRARNLQAAIALSRGDTNLAGKALEDGQKILAPLWRANPNEALRQLEAERLLLAGDLATASGRADQADSYWNQAEQTLLSSEPGAVPFERLDSLVRTMRRLQRIEESIPHQQRLEAAGYVMERDWPGSASPLARRRSNGQ